MAARALAFFLQDFPTWRVDCSGPPWRCEAGGKRNAREAGWSTHVNWGTWGDCVEQGPPHCRQRLHPSELGLSSSARLILVSAPGGRSTRRG